jgi:phosphomannomutase
MERLASAPPRSLAGREVTGVETLDGVKLLLGSRGWILHRLSGTEPILRVYAEHEDESTVRRLLDETVAALDASAG